MDDFTDMLSKLNSSFSVNRDNKDIPLTMGEVTDCFFYNLDNMGNQAIIEACQRTGKNLTDEQILALREEITVCIMEMIEEKIDQVISDLF